MKCFMKQCILPVLLVLFFTTLPLTVTAADRGGEMPAPIGWNETGEQATGAGVVMPPADRTPGFFSRMMVRDEPDVDDPGFSLSLEVSDEDGNRFVLTVGLHPDATTGFDVARDVFAPPPGPAGTFDARLVISDEHYATFYFPTGGDEAEWPMSVRAATDAWPVSIRWNPDDVPANSIMTLENIAGATLVALDADSVFTVGQSDPRDMVITWAAVDDTEPGYVLPSDSLALVDLYNATGGPDWERNDGWLVDPVSEWMGVVVEGNRVDQIILPANNLTGSLPASIGDLDALRNLQLGFNNLTGELPASLLDLENLMMLNLHQNQLTGELYTPAFWSAFPEMRVLSMAYNGFSGQITPEIENMPHLTQLWLYNNRINGSIPDEIGTLLQLEAMELGGFIPGEVVANLTGTFPATMANLENLYHLMVWNTTLEGDIEELFGMLNPDVLRNLLIASSFTGELGPWIGDYGQLINLQLAANDITGGFPQEIFQLHNLQILKLQAQPMAFEFPSGWPQLPHLRTLALSRIEGLTGSVPGDIGDMESLTRLLIHNNPSMSGRLPEALLPLELQTLDYWNTPLITPVYTEFRKWLESIEVLWPGGLAEISDGVIWAPGDESRGVPVPAMMSWAGLPYSNYYHVEIYADEALQDTVSIMGGFNGTWLRADFLEYNTEYFWRVRGMVELVLNQGENPFRYLPGPWSPVSSFTTMLDSEVGPQLVTPAHEAEEVEIPVAFSWEAVAGADSYYLEVSRRADFHETIAVKFLDDTTFGIDDLPDETVYFWRVRGMVAGTPGGWSETRSFTTELRIPDVPVWSPWDGQDDVESDVVLVWGVSNRAEVYDVQVATDREFGTLFVSETGLEETELAVSGLAPGTTYFWRVRAGNRSGYSEWSEPLRFSTVTSSDFNDGQKPLVFELKQNYPNPFNPVTVIEYTLAEAGDVRLQVFDATGRLVGNLVGERQSAGRYTVHFDGSGLSSGVYVYRLQTGSQIAHRRMTLLK